MLLIKWNDYLVEIVIVVGFVRTHVSKWWIAYFFDSQWRLTWKYIIAKLHVAKCTVKIWLGTDTDRNIRHDRVLFIVLIWFKLLFVSLISASWAFNMMLGRVLASVFGTLFMNITETELWEISFLAPPLLWSWWFCREYSSTPLSEPRSLIVRSMNLHHVNYPFNFTHPTFWSQSCADTNGLGPMTHWIAMEMQQTHRNEYTNEIMLSLRDLGIWKYQTTWRQFVCENVWKWHIILIKDSLYGTR